MKKLIYDYFKDRNKSIDEFTIYHISKSEASFTEPNRPAPPLCEQTGFMWSSIKWEHVPDNQICKYCVKKAMINALSENDVG